MKKKTTFNFAIYTLVAWGIFGTLSAQNVHINGTGKDIGGKNIRLITYADRISFLEIDSDSCFVAETDTTFHLQTTISAPIEAILRVEMYDFHFIIEPERKYKITIDSFPYTMDNESLNPLLYAVPLPASIHCSDPDDLNRKLFRFNAVVDSFTQIHAQPLFHRGKKLYFDSLLRSVATLCDSNDSSYYGVYTRCHLATLAYMGKMPNSIKMIKSELNAYPIPYHNMGYMELFNLYFTKYFTEGRRNLTSKHINYWINNDLYAVMMDSLGLDPLLRNEVIRELVFLKGMQEAFYSPHYNETAVLNFLERFRHETKFSEHRTIATNILANLRKKQLKGRPMPDFCLRNIDSALICLDHFRGKPIYLSFVKVRERASLLELETMRHFYASRKNDCVFITVACDRSFATMYNFLKNSKIGSQYTWTWLYFDDRYDILERYGARTFPFFVSIDPNGNVIAAPALQPKEGGYNF